MPILSARIVALFLGLLGSSLLGETLESLYSFPSDGSEGTQPLATLTVGPNGSLYGTTSSINDPNENQVGTIFKVALTGQVTILNHFEKTSTGAYPYARLVNPGDGFLYGVTSRNGGITGDPVGTVYRLDPSNSDLSVVFQLKLPPGEDFPRNPRSLVSAKPGALHVLGYAPGGLWHVPLNGTSGTVIKNFNPNNPLAEGADHEKIILGSNGYLYGGSARGGVNSNGMLFRIAPDGSRFERLHSCVSATGYAPIGAMVEGPDGNFYGTMRDGGKRNQGVIFRLSPTGDYDVIHNFTDLRYPEGDLMIATDGFIYGTAWDLGPGGNGNGGVFRIKPDGSKYKVVYTFEESWAEPFYPNGRKPIGGLVQGSDGYLYGTTRQGGEYDAGTVFRLKLDLPRPPVNRPPVAVDDYYTLTTPTSVTIPVTANDFDPDGDDLDVTIKLAPQFGTATVQPDGSILYTPTTYGSFDTFYYKISDQRGGIDVATVTIRNTPPAPLLVAGNYNGLFGFNEGTTPLGRFVLSVRTDGKFTGTLFTQKKRVPLKGTFDDDGTAAISVNLPNQGRRTMFLYFKRGTPNTVTAKVYGQKVSTGTAGPTIPATSGMETYTVQITPDNSNAQMPKGYGYGVMSLKPSGAVTMVGTLGDGTKLAWSSSLTMLTGSSTSIPIFAEPLKDGAFVTIAAGNENTVFESEARWIRPGAKKDPYASGFDGKTDVLIVPFTKPSATDPVLAITNGTVRISEGPIVSPVSGTFTIDGKKITPDKDGDLRKLTINRENGLFSGTIVSGKTTYNFKGVIYPAGINGVGSVFVKGESGKVDLFQPIE